MNTMEFISESEWAQISEEDRRRIAMAVAEDRAINNEKTTKINLRKTWYLQYGKRIFDLILSSIALVICSPLNLIIAIVTYFDVGSPIIFKQKRIGKNGRHFDLIKFRNMTNETNEWGILLPPEQRVTKWGTFVRKTSLDELLNFWCVFKGDMSIIGPRALPIQYEYRFNEVHQQRHLVRPGLECPFHDKRFAGKGWQGRFDNDVWYVENIGFITDIKMLALLVKKVFSKKERQESATGKTGEFIGYYPDGTIMDEWGIPRKYLKEIKE